MAENKDKALFSGAGEANSSGGVRELLSKLAHDFNDLLVGIEGSARMILDGEMLKPEGMPLLEQILSCAERANELTKEMQEHGSVAQHIPSEALSGMCAEETGVTSSFQDDLLPDEARPVVLFIDDEHIVRSVGRSILERAGFKVLTASSGEDGIRKFERYSDKIHCVILDMVMPFMSGNLVFAKLKAARPDIRVLLISGYTDKQTLRQFQEHEIEGFLQKPFAPESLVSKVQEIVGRTSSLEPSRVRVGA